MQSFKFRYTLYNLCYVICQPLFLVVWGGIEPPLVPYERTAETIRHTINQSNHILALSLEQR